MYKGIHRIKKECPGLDSLNIGGGFPSKFEYDYQYMIDEIINQIKLPAMKPKLTFHIFTEFLLL
jgi:arginine decarboxylase